MDEQIIELWEWQPVPDKPGTSTVKRCRTYYEVLKEVVRCLGEEDLSKLDYFNIGFMACGKQWPLPRDIYRLVVFPVTGGSEGHYIHVEVIDRDRKTECVYLAKTFEGWDFAWEFAKKLGKLLGV